MVELGTIVAGKYLLDRVIGQGGMGLVVQATHLHLHQPVAIKLLLPHVSQDAETVQRFVREARAAVRLHSEHVARVFDVGALEDGTPYMVLEYLEGTDLANFPRDQLTLGTLIDLLLQACEALAEAHALGIVHRDIKPSNFFITRDPGGALFLKLLDFGISKTAGATGKLTASQVMLGTPSYMSPEQMRTPRKVDPRSDIWSLGIVLYELIEGAPPFETEAFSAMVLKIVNDPPARLTVRLPAGLDSVIYRCLEKDPRRRFQSTAALAAALAPHAGSPAQAAITLERTRGLDPGPRHVAAGADHASHRAASADSEPTTAQRAPIARRWRRSLITAVGIATGAGVVALASVQGHTTARLPDPVADVFADPAAPVGTTPPILAAPRSVTAPAAPPAQPTVLPSDAAVYVAPPVDDATAAATVDVAPPVDATTAKTVDVAPVDDTTTTAGSGKPPDAPVRRPHRPRPATNNRGPARPEIQRDSPRNTAPSPRFDRGD
jgi:hypothetical protein